MDKKVLEVIKEYIDAANSPLGSYSGIAEDNDKPQQDADDL